jgi:hypothetical protein
LLDGVPEMGIDIVDDHGRTACRRPR